MDPLPQASATEGPVRLRFRHVEAFRAVLHTGTVTGAAASLGVTQPAVSNLMAEMEEIVGFSLFDRRGGRLVPTASADQLLEEIDRCFLSLDHVNRYCERMRAAMRRSVIVAAVPVVSLSLLPKAIAAYRESVDAAFFTVHSRITEQVVSWVGSQRVDIGFAVPVPPLPGVRSEVIWRFSAVCALPAGHHLANRPMIRAEDLDGEPFIVTSRSEGLAAPIARVFNDFRVRPRETAECPMISAACAMAAAGVGVTIIDPLAAYSAGRAGVVFRPFEPEIPVDYCAYWIDSSRAAFDRPRLLDLMRAAASSIEAEVKS